MDLVERARKYLGCLEASVSGSNGHDRCYQAACALVHGFDFDEGVALRVLMEEFNPRCSPPWSERELRHKVSQARKSAGNGKPVGYLVGRPGKGSPGGGGAAAGGSRSSAPGGGGVEPERVKKRQVFMPEALKRMMARGFSPDAAYLAEQSPLDPRGVSAQGFLDAIFRKGEKTIVFFNYFSQGQFGHVAGSPGRSWYLGDRPGPAPVKVGDGEFPEKGRLGAWFIPCPLDGEWYPNGKVDDAGNAILSRRTEKSIVTYRHMLLESDEAPESEWLNLICQLPLPITALYTSGGRSIHALVRIDTESKSQFDAFRDRVTPILSKLGADPAAITGMRLTRLPGIIREGTMTKEGKYFKYTEPRLQRLLYLNPEPTAEAIKMMPRLRRVEGEETP